MSAYYERPELQPKNGHTLVVGIAARISGCANQKELSLDDQVDHGKHVAADLYDGKCEFRTIMTTGKGERLDRPELATIEGMFDAGELDLFIVEDLGRLVRGHEAVRLLGVGVDCSVRCISPNDDIDTADSDWEQRALEACREHVAHNAHTSKRLKQKLMNRFEKLGGAPGRPIAGYVVPPDAKTYYEWKRDDTFHDVIVEGMKQLRKCLNCSTVADYFNAQGFRVGPYARCERWYGALVRNLFKNRLLGGYPERGRKHTIKQFRTGRRVSAINPAGPRSIHVPHLAHVPIEELDDLNRALTEANKHIGRRALGTGNHHTKYPWKRTTFPGHAAECWYCGHAMAWGGNGLTDALICSGARKRRCWFGASFKGSRLAHAVMAAIWKSLEDLVDMDPLLAQIAGEAEKSNDLESQLRQLEQDQTAHANKRERVKKRILETDTEDLLLKEILEELKRAEQELSLRRARLERAMKERQKPICSAKELRMLFQKASENLAMESPEMGDVLRRLVKECHVYGVRCIDGGAVKPRARVTICLEGLIPESASVPGLTDLVTRTWTFDLFDPPQHVKYLQSLPATKLINCARLAEELSANGTYVTKPAIQRSLHLRNRIAEQNLTDPYELVSEPPVADKLRRHRHRYYQFQPRDGYERPPLQL